VGFFYDNLWGKFRVQQTILDLTGSQEKKFSSKAKINARIGIRADLLTHLRLSGEINLFSGRDAFDFRFILGASYVF
jgi:hypothetical protein